MQILAINWSQLVCITWRLLYTHTHTQVYMVMHTHIYTHKKMNTHICTRTTYKVARTHTLAHTQTQTHTHAPAHAHTHAHKHAHIYWHTNWHTHTHGHTSHEYTHTHTHTHTHIGTKSNTLTLKDTHCVTTVCQIESLKTHTHNHVLIVSLARPEDSQGTTRLLLKLGTCQVHCQTMITQHRQVNASAPIMCTMSKQYRCCRGPLAPCTPLSATPHLLWLNSLISQWQQFTVLICLCVYVHWHARASFCVCVLFYHLFASIHLSEQTIQFNPHSDIHSLAPACPAASARILCTRQSPPKANSIIWQLYRDITVCRAFSCLFPQKTRLSINK